MGCDMVGTKGPGLDGLDDQLGGVYAKISERLGGER